MNLYVGFIPVKIYTGEDLKWDTPTGCNFKSLQIPRHRRIKMSHFKLSKAKALLNQ